MTRKWQWRDPKVWIPLLTVIIGSIVGPIIVIYYQRSLKDSPEDITPPTISVPQTPILAEADTSSGAANVTYSVSASDNVDGTVAPSCEPSSGSTFAIGDTTVICTAKDKAGNSAGESRFTIRVTEKPQTNEKEIQYSFLKAWGNHGVGKGQFNNPDGVAVDPQGRYVYVADDENNRIQKFDTNGVFVTSWGTPGTGNGQFDGPNGVAVDPQGRYVYVSDDNNHRIQIWAPSDDSSANGVIQSNSKALQA